MQDKMGKKFAKACSGYRFYLVYPNKQEKAKGRAKMGQLGNHEGNCIAVPLQRRYGQRQVIWWSWGYVTDAISAVYFQKNSPVCFTSVSGYFLQERCKRVSQEIARSVHPALFEYLES
jgi:hypothetical protein